MQRTILRTNGEHGTSNVGDGFEMWNEVIHARTGELIVSPDGTIELWTDEEGLMKNEPELNMAASMLVGRRIVGDAIVFFPGDVK